MKKNRSIPAIRGRLRSVLLNMGITFVFLILTLGSVTASVYSQETSIQVKLENATVEDILKNIEEQTEFRFLYRSDLLRNIPAQNINIKDAKIEEVLDKILVPYGFNYEIDDRTVIIKKAEKPAEIKKPVTQENQEIKGKVTDKDGKPIPGVSIVVKGTTMGTITDPDGNYTLSIPESAQTLVFSFVGMEPQEVAINGRSQVDITMKESNVGLNEVVVVGYGTMKKLDVSGAIVSADAQVIKEVPSVSATKALQGRLPGIQISQTSTRPGSDMQIRIRGVRSINATNDPLIVVDGIPFAGSLNDISPSDIKSIDILKDASSTAIYGSRGANGVILITTFRGRVAEKPTVSYNGYYGIKAVAKKYPVYNGEEFQAFRHATLNPDYKDNYTALEQASIASKSYTDWQDLMYQNAMVTSHDVSVSAGTNKGAYSLGAGYYDETAVLPGQKYTRYSLRTAIDQQIGQFVKIGLSSQNSFGITDGEGFADESKGLMNNIITLSPLLPAYNEDGSIRQIPTEGWIDTYYNPLLIKNSDLWQEKRKRFASFNSLYGEVKFTNSLKYRINLGLSYSHDDYGNYFGSDTPFKNGSVSSATVQNVRNTVWTVENLLYYDKVFAEKHRLNVTAMYSAEESEYVESRMSADDLPADYLFYYNLGLANGAKNIVADDQDYHKRGLLSYMARAQYAYDDRYMVTLTFRADGASVLAPGHQWHNYPALSAGWNINKESFLKEVKAINQLKLRFGYGQTSNQAISPYATKGELAQVPYNFGSNNMYGYYVSTLPNSNLGWEYTQSYNGGLDFSLFNNRISGYFDYYYQKTKDVLVKVNLPQSAGVSNPMWQNVGETRNKGFELSLSAQVIKPADKGGFGWDVDFNIYANRNKLLSLNSGVSEDIGNGLFVGHPINVIYDYKKLGIIQENEAPYFGRPAGQIKVADLNNDGRISADGDRTILGSFEPDFAGGLSTRFYYKNFDLSVVSFFKSGGMLVSSIYMPQSYLSTNNGRRNSIRVDYWTPEHTSGTYPQPGNQNTADVNDFGSTLGYFDASYWKFRTISLGYTFDESLLSKIGCRDARVYFTCENPFVLFSPYMDAGGLDPEPTGRGGQGANETLSNNSGIQARQLTIGANTPPTRNFIIGLSMKF